MWTQAGSNKYILIVEDDPGCASIAQLFLASAGYELEIVETGEAALDQLAAQPYDLVLCDRNLPFQPGMEVLARVRECYPNLPVILMTAAPSVESAAAALDLGAAGYLAKPLRKRELLRAIERAIIRAERAGESLRARSAELARERELRELDESFDRALEGLWMAAQPILTADGKVEGHEFLMRSVEPNLPNAGAVLVAAESLDRVHHLGRRVRALVAQAAKKIPGLLFVNIHPLDLQDSELLRNGGALAAIAHRTVLELTERTKLDQDEACSMITYLRALGFRFAIDDLGAGYASLSAVAAFQPEIVKLDMSLVRDIGESPRQQRLVRAIVSFCVGEGTKVVAEGIETARELEVVQELGCELLQGYFLGRPARPGLPHPTANATAHLMSRASL